MKTRTAEEVRKVFEASGVSVSAWARARGFSTTLVYQVLDGRRKCLRGQSFAIAVALGLKSGMPLEVDDVSRMLDGAEGKETIM